MKYIADAVIPTLNSSRFLERCLSSIRNQECGECINIIIIDGGSKDDTLSIAKEFNAEVQIKRGMYSDGKNGARNYGIGLCKSDYCWKLDSDNILVGNKVLNSLMMPFENNKVIISDPLPTPENNKLTFNNYLTYLDRINMINTMHQGTREKGYVFLEDLNYGLNNASIIRKDALKLVGYDQDIATLTRLRSMHLSGAAIVPDANFIHLQTAGFIDYIKKLNRRVKISSELVKSGKENYFFSMNNYKLSSDISHTNSLSPFSAISNSLKYFYSTKEKIFLMVMPLALSYILVALTHPIASYNTYKNFV